MSAKNTKPKLILAFDHQMWADISTPGLQERLASLFGYHFEEFDLPSDQTESPPADAEAEKRLVSVAYDADALVVSHGSPHVRADVLDQLPHLRFVGELEGDRFASRIDVQACWRKGITVVDTNNFCSPPVAEWALALMLMGLRNYGSLFRRAVFDRQTGRPEDWSSNNGFLKGELTEKTVGIIGFGHISRRLLELLVPFGTRSYVCDPYVPSELAEIYRTTLTTLDNVLGLSDVVVCTVPITPRTEGLLGPREFGLMKEGAVFVNVSRGKVVQQAALIERVRTGTLIACLDVTDPEPLPPESELIDLPGVILSPHIAGIVGAGRPRSLSLMLDELTRYFAGHETWFTLVPRTIANRYGAPSDPTELWPGSEDRVSHVPDVQRG